jgi:hypothetical protein
MIHPSYHSPVQYCIENYKVCVFSNATLLGNLGPTIHLVYASLLKRSSQCSSKQRVWRNENFLLVQLYRLDYVCPIRVLRYLCITFIDSGRSVLHAHFAQCEVKYRILTFTTIGGLTLRKTIPSPQGRLPCMHACGNQNDSLTLTVRCDHI